MKDELEVLRTKLAEKLTVGKPKPIITKKGNELKSIKDSNDTSFDWVPEGNDNFNGNGIIIKNDDSVVDKGFEPEIEISDNIEEKSQNGDWSNTKNLNRTENFIYAQERNDGQNIIQANNNDNNKGQTSLRDFQIKKNANQKLNVLTKDSVDKIKVIVDHREFNSTVVRELVERKVEIFTKQLPVGDYIISENIVIERKLVSDFLQSLVDGRLFSQLKSLKDAYTKPILILEGEGLLTSRKIHSSAIYGALVSVISDFNIPIISTENSKESAEIIRALATREQLENNSMPGIRGEKPAWTLPERQRFVIEGLPNVSGKLAQRLLEHFGSVKAVFSADVAELSKVKGIGKKTAEEIKKVIEERFSN
jgi:Fanconi anemia group M protein